MGCVMRDDLKFTMYDGRKIALTGCQARCTKCGEVKPLSEFGLREMPDGTIRNQPQCKKCRSRKKEAKTTSE